MEMRYKLYIWADGVNFDAFSFQKGLNDARKGSVVVPKRIISTASGPSIWNSETQEFSASDPISALASRITSYREDVESATRAGADRIVVELVAYCEDPTSISGFYFSKETIALFNGLGVGVDIDFVIRFD